MERNMESVNVPTFGSKLKEVRSRMGMNQSQFADYLGINQSLLSKYEKITFSAGNDISKPPKADHICNICKKCNVSADWLLGLAESQTCNVKDDKTAMEALTQLASFYKDKIHIKKAQKEEGAGFDWTDSETIFVLDDKVANSFFKEYLQMKPLYDSGSVPQAMFNQWMKDRINDILKQKEEEEKKLPF